jgi:hypothetical protein
MSVKDTDFLKSGLFTPAVVRELTKGRTSTFQSVVGADLTGSNIASTSSFRYDSPGTGLKSSQQIPVDFSKFENHTFFNSAESNVNVAFDKIINGFPFDGNRQELESFFDRLSGYEKWVYDQFPKSRNYYTSLINHYIETPDYVGSLFPTLSRKNTGESILSPSSGSSLAIEFWVYAAGTQTPGKDTILVQKISQSADPVSVDTQGISVGWNNAGATTIQPITFCITSGTYALSASTTWSTADGWQHFCMNLNKGAGVNRLEIFRNGTLVVTSSNNAEIGEIDFANAPLTFFSGTIHQIGGTTVLNGTNPAQGLPLLGFDEFRLWHTTRTPSQIQEFMHKSVYAQDDLKLYYKFNEASGSHVGERLVLDSSGNSLHGQITDEPTFTAASFTDVSIHRSDPFGWGLPPMDLEDENFNPVLFPLHHDVLTLHSLLIHSASQYDANNPNLITNLIPRHYLLEGAFSEGFEDEDGDLTDLVESNNSGAPGSAKFGSTQIMSTFLFIWAKYFDEMKIFIDQFSKLNHIDYTADDNIADTFLPFYAKQLGFDLPTQFTVESLEKYLDAANLLTERGLSSKNILEIQNLIWRRILTTLKEVVRSRGTQHSVKAFMRSLGLEPNKNFRIREYGGKTRGELKYSTEVRTSDIRFLNFSGSLANVTPTLDAQGLPNNKPFLITNYLSSSRIEPGLPQIVGNFVNGVSDDVSDGLFTSSSFTVEALYKFDEPLTGSHPLTQSLMRLHATGAAGTAQHVVLANAVAFAPDGLGTTGSVRFLSADGNTPGTDSFVDFSINDVNIFDGNVWHLTVGREIVTEKSASYFMALAKAGIEFTDIKKSTALGGHSDVTYYKTIDTTLLNPSGTFVVIGSQSVSPVGSIEAGLQDPDISTNITDIGLYTDFSGKVSSLNFWSKALTNDEIKWHALDPTSIGVTDPYINFNYETKLSGTFERMRLNLSMDQPVTQSDASGNLTIIDFSQATVSGTIDRPFDPATVNRLLTFDAQGRGFEASKQVIQKHKVRHSIRTSKFDVNATDNKVRIRTLQDPETAEDVGAEIYGEAPFLRERRVLDDSRFAIEIDSVQALDEDIMRIFGTMQALDDALGGAESMYHDEYPKLRLLRQIYFNRLVDKINLTTFFEFFRYFDDSITSFVEKILPHNTDFLGVNFTIGPHVLERQRFRYLNDDIYLQESDRTLVGDDFGPEVIDSL